MELKDLNIHCRNCTTYEYRPKYMYHSNQSPDFSELFPDVNSAFKRLRNCKSLFLCHEEMVDIGSDSFVFLDNRESPHYVIKLYLDSSLRRINNYKREKEEFREEVQGKEVYAYGKEFTVNVNPILGVEQLKHEKCVAAISEYIPGENEYTRYMRESEEHFSLHPEKSLYYSGIHFYENILKESVGRYIHPLNFKVDEQECIIHITDIDSCVG